MFGSEILLERKARQEILESLMEKECLDMVEVQAAIQSLISNLDKSVRYKSRTKIPCAGGLLLYTQ